MVLTIAAPSLAQPAGDMKAMPGMDQASMTIADGAGVVRAIDAKAGTMTIQHGPIDALKWPAMTMTFKASPASLLNGVVVGQAVKFKLMRMGGAVQLTAIGPN